MNSIKTINLISSLDSMFVDYQRSFKKEGVKSEKDRTKSEMISHVLELTTRDNI
ncbi:MAG: hypothetical protein ACOYOT_00400 [Bacteroidales bacterium]